MSASVARTSGARVCLGQIGAAHGVRGEVRLRSFTSDPASIADYGPLETEDGQPIEIEKLRPAKDHFVARLAGIRDRDAASALTNVKLYVARERLPQTDDPDEFYHADLVGLAAVDQSGNVLGTVIEFSNFAAFGIDLDGAWWPTVENYYQAQKFADPALQKTIRQAAQPIIAKNL